MPPVIAENLDIVISRIHAAATAAGRQPKDVHLLAVSKNCSSDTIRKAVVAGQQSFGENYVKEALEKMTELANTTYNENTQKRLIWHFIGPLQTNKTKLVATNFDWVHSVDRLKTAERLSLQRPAYLPPLQVCLQVNISGETSKSGTMPEDVQILAKTVASLPNIQLRGLMTIPKATTDPIAQRCEFATLRMLYERLNTYGLALDTLSMGMSHDLETAIAEGATIVRVGTAIFGARN
ncbi:YggS family pyridoxal phosphate-dependent enzyme [Candidatus Pandoraea novymonadis]|uniref:Pyridoxal phosphate homeostasis protein n=1 Tax=Candidatus Pandoraea novymonadis TaxID=1808959 RepID=A0ABX5FDQ9_9BURK|nr:YggS family pyridoxal phosphate-dependent enzyme [Candidatus Pandoraea novymonadis]PSB91869.1 hypothetical protein BZL35_00086 [Candidatus Pandoraea novymonadis]